MEVYDNRLTLESRNSLASALGKSTDGYFTLSITENDSFEDVILRLEDGYLQVHLQYRENPTEIDEDISELSIAPCPREFAESPVGTIEHDDGTEEPNYRKFHCLDGKIERIAVAINDGGETLRFTGGREIKLIDVCGIAFVLDSGKALVLDKRESYTDFWQISIQPSNAFRFDVDGAEVEWL